MGLIRIVLPISFPIESLCGYFIKLCVLSFTDYQWEEFGRGYSYSEDTKSDVKCDMRVNQKSVIKQTSLRSTNKMILGRKIVKTNNVG